MRFRLRFSRFWVIPLICGFITLYFVYHGLSGNFGIARMYEVDREIASARKQAAQTAKTRALLEQKVKSLSAESLDLDQLEESAARILYMAHPEDFVVFDGFDSASGATLIK
ncbi:MAG: septum formation initiator family protein [Lactobacillales bacterium]|jgi:cell division protein FtsB|nr:septum formation initiator family protein [Lactobacillales bacterium]